MRFFLKKLKSNTYLTYFEMEAELLMRTDHQYVYIEELLMKTDHISVYIYNRLLTRARPPVTFLLTKHLLFFQENL
jgi:hypothetical protein